MADLPPRTRGVIALLEANCTVCMICARECPDWCIHIDSHTEVEQQPGSARPRARNVLDRFAIDYGQCLYCGICVEACPFDALHWAPDFSYPGTGTPDGSGAVAELVHERDVLATWVDRVPPPPPLDPAAEPAPEAATGRPGRPGARPGAGPGARPVARPGVRPAQEPPQGRGR
ncbi:4Fe-4S binding protein [Actinosynnema mirum]|uniref:4Fe-4S ferredoxin iron-sulfur binding domain protein n=1 Tax=Actinosynnema mirum (strain ATCC 29888 / DSM 43827 / JCM 3225 / NBRC 14064 / NCIMB 13271 / NRRL B-12336 / IMRU 3971 / 101) TaxID=446462 RepID=C6WN89_ACTMD|nr:4Fe-4S binding protein [Actinosynnema mirum]ACU40453.1 4Fe-4S ferredoxin iron-sulfur binding domain protein [Actinosynnema mirum DSM 43827]AXX33967.1 NADH-ubiquinone oxidoreductase chain I [Actinosynnema pretiosum subsp. pretiosum]